ncbi:MAG: hypothetical protein ACTHNO_23580, partial [Ralstonia sp.]
GVFMVWGVWGGFFCFWGWVPPPFVLFGVWAGAGKADAFAMDDVLLYGFRATSPNPAEYAIVGSNLAVAPYAIMLGKDDAEFKKVIDLAMSRTILDGEAEKLYKKWFQQPIPPNGVKLEIPMSFLLRDSFKFPTDKVAD